MCDPVTAGLILTAVGGGTQFVNNQAALRRQDRQAAEGIRRQGEIQRGANERVGAQIEDIATSTGETERAQALEGFLDALRVADSTTTGALPTVPGANQRFAESVEANTAALRGEGEARAGRLARIDAPRFQRIREQGRVGRTASDLGELGRQSRAEDFLTQLRVASEQPNEFINALGSIMQGAGSVIALGGGGLNFLKGGPNLSKLAEAGTLIDSPTTAARLPGVFA